MERSSYGPRPTPAVLKILLADPDRARAAPLVSGLQLHGYAVGVVVSAREAWHAMTTHHVHLLVTELDLPDIEGADWIRTIRTVAETQHVLLMVMTTRSGISSKIAAFQAGADDYLVKPVEPETLVIHVRRLLSFRQLSRM